MRELEEENEKVRSKHDRNCVKGRERERKDDNYGVKREIETKNNWGKEKEIENLGRKKCKKKRHKKDDGESGRVRMCEETEIERK